MTQSPHSQYFPSWIAAEAESPVAAVQPWCSSAGMRAGMRAAFVSAFVSAEQPVMEAPMLCLTAQVAASTAVELPRHG